MNYLISTSYQNNNYSHLVKGLDLQEIEELFHPLSISQYEQENFIWDLMAQWMLGSKQFQIISSLHRVVDLFQRLYAFNAINSKDFTITSINSISQPLDEERSQELVKQLIIKTEEQKKVLTPKVVALIDSMIFDVKDFITRFTWYIDDKDSDILESWLHDMQIYGEQWNIPQVKEVMWRLIEKMEILEGEYVKSINTDNEAPLEEFNHELNSIINQNRLFRNHNLNQLSWGSNFDYILFKWSSRLRLFFDSLWTEFKDLSSLFKMLLSYCSSISLSAVIMCLIISYIYQIFTNESYSFPYVMLWIWGLMSSFIYNVSKKNLFFSVPVLLLCVFGWYYMYQAITVNFWL